MLVVGGGGLPVPVGSLKPDEAPRWIRPYLYVQTHACNMVASWCYIAMCDDAYNLLA